MTPLARLVGWAFTAFSGLGLIAGAGRVVYALLDPRRGESEAYFLIFFALFAIAYLLPAFVAGLGLARGEPWARLPVALLAALLLVAFPLGTAFGLFSLWALRKPSESPPQSGQAALAPGPSTAQRLGGLLAVAWVGAGFVIVLGAGFRLNHQPAPSYLGWGFWPAIVLFAAISLYAAAKWRPARSPMVNPLAAARAAAERRREHLAWREARSRRIATLEADPVRAPYARRSQAGEVWSDEQIAYDMERDRLATCPCLSGIEAHLRAKDLDVRLVTDRNVRAPCCVNEPALRAQMRPPEHVMYAEFFYGGRAPEDDPAAFLRCNEHDSAIEVLHPKLAEAATVWVPEPPV